LKTSSGSFTASLDPAAGSSSPYVSLDGTRDISPARGTELIEALLEKFNSPEKIDCNLSAKAKMPGIFTTASAGRLEENLLPWIYPAILYRLKSLLSGQGFGPWPPVLTVFCLGVTKPST